MIYIILSRVGHTLFSSRLLISPMLLSCIYRYKLKGFHFKPPQFFKQGRLWWWGNGSTYSSPEGTNCFQHNHSSWLLLHPCRSECAFCLQGNSQTERRVLDIVPSLCQHSKSWDLFSNALPQMWSHTNGLFVHPVSQRSVQQYWAGDQDSQTLKLSLAI